jgi:hypothetical protein
MHLSRIAHSIAVGTGLTLALSLAAPALAHPAHDGPPPEGAMDTRPDWREHGPHRPGIDSPAREHWLMECERRMAHGHKDKDRYHARQDCSAYYDDYYARYQGYGYQYGYGYGCGSCAQPMMMVPVMMMPMAGRSEPKCTETVEIEYVDVPVTTRSRPRPVPQKRVKVVPDKRVKTVPDKRIRK